MTATARPPRGQGVRGVTCAANWTIWRSVSGRMRAWNEASRASMIVLAMIPWPTVPTWMSSTKKW